jgi:fumarate reductase subunit D
VLTFVMVASPIGFAGAAIPALSGFSKIWWKYLLREAFFAPVLLLLIFISLKITDTFSKGGSLGAALATANTSTIGVIFIFVLIIAFLLGSLAAAKKLGATGSSMAVKGGGKLAFGVTAAVGRRTVGRASGAAAKYIRKSPISTSFAGRTLAGVADKGAASSFDFRATKAAGALSKSTKLDFGKPQKGGYDAIVKKGVDDRIKYAESLKQSDAEKAEATALIDANKKIQEQKEKAEKTLTDSTKNVESANTRDTATLNRTNRTQDVVKTVYEEEVADRNARILSALGRADVETQTKEREDLKKVVEKYEADSRRIEAEKKALVDAIRERTAAQEKNVEELTTKIQETDAQLKQNNTRLNGEEKDGVLVKAGIGPDAKKAFYADKMVRGFNITSNPFGNSGNARPSASGRARREAAAKIRSGLKKTSDQKLIDAFKAELLKEDKKPEKAEEAAPAT